MWKPKSYCSDRRVCDTFSVGCSAAPERPIFGEANVSSRICFSEGKKQDREVGRKNARIWPLLERCSRFEPDASCHSSRRVPHPLDRGAERREAQGKTRHKPPATFHPI